MIDSFSMRSRNRQPRVLSISIFAISLLSLRSSLQVAATRATLREQPMSCSPLQHRLLRNHRFPQNHPLALMCRVEEPIVEEPKVSFKDDIQPILAERCSIPGCHAAPGAGGLDLTAYDTFKKGGNGGVAFDAGNGKGSLVVKRIDGGGMPLFHHHLMPIRSNSSSTGLTKVPRITKL